MQEVIIDNEQIKELINRWWKVADEMNVPVPVCWAACQVLLDSAKEFGYSHIQMFEKGHEQ